MSFIDRIKACFSESFDDFVPLVIGTAVLGAVHRDHVSMALNCLPGSCIEDCSDGDVLVVSGSTSAALTDIFRQGAKNLAELGEVPVSRGEYCSVPPPTLGDEILQVDRVLLSWFGFPTEGVHLNATGGAGGSPQLWVAKRSQKIYSFPGQYDNLVAGGIPAGMSPRETLIMEASEEVGLKRDLISQAKQASRLSFRVQDGRRVRWGLLHCFDLRVPEGIAFSLGLDEVEEVRLWDSSEVQDKLASSSTFKFNSALVFIDFLLRNQLVVDHEASELLRNLGEACWKIQKIG